MGFILILVFIFNLYRAFDRAQDIICTKPNRFWLIIAPPGTGKTTLAAKEVRDSIITDSKIYSNVPIRGAMKIDIKKDLGVKELHDCSIIIDEAGSDLNNRAWHTNLTDKAIEFIKKHRHYNVDIYCFSQAPNDMDNKFRDLVTQLFLLNKSRVPFTIYAQAIDKVMKLQNGEIVQYYEENKKASFRFTMPKTWAYFNSFDRKMDLKDTRETFYTIIDLK